ncbi:MAG TPA: hypothetical protein VN647_01665 [Nitrospira sp.]|nr:hypothetical protein [Nitrospira sp.]HWV46027.1 hypothetical protein [Nitrospira sp.]
MDGPDIRIGEVVTDIVVTEGVGTLSADDVKRIVALVVEHLRHEQERITQRTRDTAIHNQAYQRS